MTLKKATKWMSVLSVSLILAACDQEAQDEAQDDQTEEAAPADDAGEESSDDQAGEEEAGDEEADGEEEAGDQAAGDFDYTSTLNASTREDGSGTRSAFVEIVGLEDEDGNDQIDQSITVQDGTNAVITGVQEDLYALGYVSVGAIQGNDEVKALQVEGVEPTPENIKAGDYDIARDFNLVYGEDLSEQAQDFLDFVLSAEGQAVVEENGEVPVDDGAEEFTGGDVSGEVQINGSTSVTPLIEKLTEEYNAVNPDVTFDIASTGSSAGVTAAIDGTADIGMSSRDITEEEQADLGGVESIAIDGIAVIVNPENPVEDITIDQLQSIYLNETTTWEEFE